jgi:hypothetical protein
VLSYPRETVEYLPIDITVTDENGDPIEDPDYEVSVVLNGERPEDWTAPPYLITALDPGTYDTYVRVTDSPEIPVALAGRFLIT